VKISDKKREMAILIQVNTQYRLRNPNNTNCDICHIVLDCALDLLDYIPISK